MKPYATRGGPSAAPRHFPPTDRKPVVQCRSCTGCEARDSWLGVRVSALGLRVFGQLRRYLSAGAAAIPGMG